MEPNIIRTGNRDGDAVVRVEIANKRGVFVTMDAADYDAWVAAGRSTRFWLNRNGPLTGTYRVVYRDRSVAGGIAGVARELLQPGPGRVVQYRDQDRLNLCRRNLLVRSGRAKGQAVAPEFADEIEDL
ncbi:hypothetical protein [Brevundimonas sp. SL130]|uniref:hypothetical protein n=1 Tax=Brevundimonas sp. SL130 TaxID=2995143 RepID=UPI00226CBE0C|nr:hypothetical protein [Brevundimonas sp. SL130]WAC60785.1 hypothetical protein OU998_04885 [Brevundimonas sp. SL130]